MKDKFLIKTIPFLTTLLLIIFLLISNQKENTRLKILIWNTPSFSLGTYLAISTSAGFLISYLATSNFANSNRIRLKTSIKYKASKINDNVNNMNNLNTNTSFEKTLIERDIREPSPTVNASFRVIGNNVRSNSGFKNYSNTNIHYDEPDRFDENMNKPNDHNESSNQVNTISTDWNDESFLNW